MRFQPLGLSVFLLLASGCGKDKPASSPEPTKSTKAPTAAGDRPGEAEVAAASPLKGFLAKDNVLVLDVRSPGEFAGGHVDGALNLPVGELEARIAEVVPDKSTPVVLHCASGGRSATAFQAMSEMGYTELFDAKTPQAVVEATGTELVK